MKRGIGLPATRQTWPASWPPDHARRGDSSIYDDYNVEGGLREDASTDVISGGSGPDAIASRNEPAVRDIVGCGPGHDEVSAADEADLIAEDCEVVGVGR
jgi:hypothetical protein